MRIRSWIEIIRPLNCLMVALAILIGYLISSSYQLLDLDKLIMAIIAGFLITGAGFIFNDAVDVEIDKIVHPTRPLPKGEIDVNTAFLVSLVIFIAGIVFSIFINVECFLIAIINSIILVVYTEILEKKGIFGNIVISYLTASSFLFGAFAAGKIYSLVTWLAIITFLAILSREIIKDVEDLEGDFYGERETLPMRIGRERSITIAIFLLGSAMIISILPMFLSLVNLFYSAIIIPNVILGFGAFQAIFDPKSSRRIIKFGMLLALIVFLLGGD